MTGRMLAIGDIHGCDVAFETLLREVAPGADDTVIVLGDVVDRGPNSKGVIDRLLRFADEVNLICILGNHEEVMLESLELGRPGWMWLGAGGRETLESYGGSLERIPGAHVEFLEAMRDSWQTETHIFSHACIDSDVPLHLQHTTSLRWTKLTGNEVPHCSGKTVICGHTSQASGRPAMSHGFICIDTKAYGGQWLTCLDVHSDMVWQASQLGACRGPVPIEEVARRF